MNNPDLAALKTTLEHAPKQPKVAAPPPAEVTPEPKQGEQGERPSLALSPPASEPDQSSIREPDADKAQAREPELPTTKNEPPERDVVLINPKSSEPVSEPVERESEPKRTGRSDSDDRAVAECQRRYSSFRVSDGTYQPFDRSSRALCPLLK